MWTLWTLLAVGVALSLQKPFNLDNWYARGDYKQGNDVLMLGTKSLVTAAVWSKDPLPYEEWTIEMVVRNFEGSKDPGDSGIALFYTSEPLNVGNFHGSSSRFDGLAITMDSLGYDEHVDNTDPSIERGAIRGHLSDGSEVFDPLRAPEQSFSLCGIPYRKAQGPISFRIGYGRGVFVVEVNRQKCFLSNRIVLPKSFIGISASTGTSEDTFALESLEVTQGIHEELAGYFAEADLEPAKVQRQVAGSDPLTRPAKQDASGPAVDSVLQAVEKLSARIDDITTKDENLKEALSLASSNDGGERVLELVKHLRNLDTRLDKIEASLRSVTPTQELLGKLNDLQGRVDLVSSNVDKSSKSVPESVRDLVQSASGGPGFWSLVVALTVTQSVLYIGYNSYLQRKNKHAKLL